MRADKENPQKVYRDFWDWLLAKPAWIITLFFAYAFFFSTTNEV